MTTGRINQITVLKKYTVLKLSQIQELNLEMTD